MVLRPEVFAGGLMVRTTPNAVAVVLVRTAWITFLAPSNHTTESLP